MRSEQQHSPLLQAAGIRKVFGGAVVLEDVSLSVSPGQIVTLIGLNGSGKTTLLKILMGLVTPDGGQVTRRPGLRLGYMPQHMAIEPVMPISVEYFLRLSAPQLTAEACRAIAREVEVEHVLAQPMQVLSGGEMQRVMLARAMLSNPDMLVLDEPVQGVDITGQAQLYALISRISKERGCAVLMVSHDLHLVMAATNHVICLNHHVCCEGHPQHVSRDPAFTALFGQTVAEQLALYTHHHHHHHDLHGNIVPSDACSFGDAHGAVPQEKMTPAKNPNEGGAHG